MCDAAVQVTPPSTPTSRRRVREGSGYDPGASRATVRARLERRRAVLRTQALHSAVRVHTGSVEEPFMTPLDALNMLFRNLGTEPVGRAEAQGAVDTVAQDFAALQTTQNASQTRKSARASLARLSRLTTARLSGGSVLSSQVVATSLLSASQDPLASVTSTQNELESHGKKALALDVVEILCAARGLTMERLSWHALRRQQDRVGAADVAPHERALVVADLYEPSFVLLLAHARVENGVDDTMPLSCPTGRQINNLQFLQLVNSAQHPVPWRLIFKNQSRRLPHNLCAVAAVYRTSCTGEGSAPCGHASDTLLGAAPVHSLAAGQGVAHPLGTPVHAPRDDAWPELPKEVATVDADWSLKAPLFASSGGRQNDDPFYTLPRIEPPGTRGGRRRAWTERLRGKK